MRRDRLHRHCRRCISCSLRHHARTAIWCRWGILPPATPEAGLLDFVNDVETVHGEGLLDRRVAAGGDVVFDALRVGAAQARGDGTQLFRIIAGLVHDGNPLVGGCIAGNLNLCHLCDRRLGN